MLPARDSCHETDTHRLKVKGWDKNILFTWTQQKCHSIHPHIRLCGHFEPKLLRRGKEVHYILLKGRINQQNITIINIHAPNNGTSMYIK